MKTLKINQERLAHYLKKFFFICRLPKLNRNREIIKQEILLPVNDVESGSTDEYRTIYKSTTRWQTV